MVAMTCREAIMSESVTAWLSFVLSLGTGAKEQKGTSVEGGVDGGLSWKR